MSYNLEITNKMCVSEEKTGIGRFLDCAKLVPIKEFSISMKCFCFGNRYYWLSDFCYACNTKGEEFLNEFSLISAHPSTLHQIITKYSLHLIHYIQFNIKLNFAKPFSDDFSQNSIITFSPLLYKSKRPHIQLAGSDSFA